MASVLSDDARETFKKYDRNARWAMSHGDALQEFEERYVAVSDGKVIASADTREEVEIEVAGVPGAYVGLVPRKGLIWIL